MITLSIVIPVYNESERISKTFEALKELRLPDVLKLDKIIFVNDGSTDNTKQLIMNEKKHLAKILKTKIEIISYKKNQGKGYAVKVGMNKSKSRYTLLTDCDISTPLSEIEKFVESIKLGTPIIIGTRKNGHSTVVVHQARYREILGKCFTLLSNVILNTWVTDFTCGFKAFSKEAKEKIFKNSKIKGWGYDAETLFLAKKFKFRIVEVPVVWSNDNRSKVNLLKDLPLSFSELISIRVYNFAPSYALLKAIKTYLF